MSQRIRIKLKSYDYNLVDKSAEKIVKTVKTTGAVVSGPIPLPTDKQIFTVNKSTFVNKKSREQFPSRPNARMQPVYIGDVVQAFADALEDRTTYGKRYELCGPRAYTLEELVHFIAAASGKRKLVVRMPDWASRLQASVLQYAPGKPFTPDNYLSLRTPSVCREDGLAALGIKATSLENAGTRILQGSDKTSRLNRLRQNSQR